MKSTLPPAPAGIPREVSEIRPRMVKADLRKAEPEWKRAIGIAIQRAMALRGWSLKEFAHALARDERQVSRWFTGQERPQFDTLFGVESLRHPLVIAFAEMAGEGIEVVTEIRVIRKVA